MASFSEMKVLTPWKNGLIWLNYLIVAVGNLFSKIERFYQHHWPKKIWDKQTTTLFCRFHVRHLPDIYIYTTSLGVMATIVKSSFTAARHQNKDAESAECIAGTISNLSSTPQNQHNPKKRWLEDHFPFVKVTFEVRTVLRECNVFWEDVPIPNKNTWITWGFLSNYEKNGLQIPSFYKQICHAGQNVHGCPWFFFFGGGWGFPFSPILTTSGAGDFFSRCFGTFFERFEPQGNEIMRYSRNRSSGSDCAPN